MPVAKNIIKAVLSEDIDYKMVDMAMRKIISLDIVILHLKEYKSAFNRLADIEPALWVYLSDFERKYCKYNYYRTMVEGKPYIDITFADTFADVDDVN